MAEHPEFDLFCPESAHAFEMVAPIREARIASGCVHCGPTNSSEAFS